MFLFLEGWAVSLSLSHTHSLHSFSRQASQCIARPCSDFSAALELGWWPCWTSSAVFCQTEDLFLLMVTECSFREECQCRFDFLLPLVCDPSVINISWTCCTEITGRHICFKNGWEKFLKVSFLITCSPLCVLPVLLTSSRLFPVTSSPLLTCTPLPVDPLLCHSFSFPPFFPLPAP